MKYYFFKFCLKCGNKFRPTGRTQKVCFKCTRKSNIEWRKKVSLEKKKKILILIEKDHIIGAFKDKNSLKKFAKENNLKLYKFYFQKVSLR